MKLRIKISRIAIVLLCACMAATGLAQQSLPAPATAPLAGATVLDFKGKVSVQPASQGPSSPTRGDILPAETVLATERGSILLQLQDGSQVLVRPHTRLVLKQPSQTDWRYLQLLIGRIRAQVQKRLGGPPPFQIGTPSAVISVRGTRFVVEVNHSITEVDVQEGSVQLDGLSGLGSSVLITPGMSSRVGPDFGPEAPRPTREIRPDVERPDGKDENNDTENDDRSHAFEADHGDVREHSEDTSRESLEDNSGATGSVPR